MIYTVGAISTDFVHHLVHDHSVPAWHAPALEEDPCHRSIFHHDNAHGCEHQAHFRNTEKCKYNHLVFQANQLVTSDTTTEQVFEACAGLSIFSFSFSETGSQTRFLRGPPTA